VTLFDPVRLQLVDALEWALANGIEIYAVRELGVDIFQAP